jgi:hypothetical protein
MSNVAFVDGWEVRSRDDGGFAVYDSHGLLSGPYGTKEAAIAAALRLPKHAPVGPRQATSSGAR